MATIISFSILDSSFNGIHLDLVGLLLPFKRFPIFVDMHYLFQPEAFQTPTSQQIWSVAEISSTFWFHDLEFPPYLQQTGVLNLSGNTWCVCWEPMDQWSASIASSKPL